MYTHSIPNATPEQASTAAPIPFHASSPRWQSALAKAERITSEYGPIAYGGVNGQWFVEGENQTYTVTATPAGYTCTCAAHSVCYHRASVVLKHAKRVAAIVAPKPARKIYNCELCGRQDVSPIHSLYPCDTE